MTEDKQLPAASPIHIGGVKSSEKIAMAQVGAEVYAAEQRAIFHPINRAESAKEMLDLCDIVSFASTALYKVPRGSSDAEGLNAHAAHELLALWGDCDSGWTSHGASPDGTETQITVYARDLQRNRRRSVTITVKHERQAGTYDKDQPELGIKRGDPIIKPVLKPQEVGELIKAAAGKEERNCLLRLLPLSLREELIRRCKQTIFSSVQDVASAWGWLTKHFSELGVQPTALLRWLNKPGADIKKLTANDMLELKVLYQGCREDRTLLNEEFPERDKSKGPKVDDGTAKIETSKEVLEGKTRTRTTSNKKTSEQSTSGSESEASQTNASESVQEKTEDAATVTSQQAAPTNAPAEAAPADTAASPSDGSASSGEPDPTRLLSKEEYRGLLDMVKNAKGMEPEEVQAWYIKRDPGAKGQRIVGLITFGDAQALREHLGIGA